MLLRSSLPIALPLIALTGLFWTSPLAAQTTPEEEALFRDEFNEEQFFLLEEEAVTIASKHAQSTREAPATITVITAEDIFRYGFRDMGDLLRAVSGWYLSNGYDYYYGGNRGVLLRGDQNTRILVLIDGHTQNEAWGSSSSLDEGLGLDLGAISRVEVLQGPSSTLYGSNAFLGIVNIVTKAGEDVGKGEARLELGSFGSTRLTMASGQKKGDLQYHARATAIATSGRTLYFPDRADSSETGGFAGPQADQLQSLGLFARVQYKDVQLMGQFVDRLKHVPTAPFNTVLGSPDTLYRQQRWFAEARINRPISKSLELMARAYYDGYRFVDRLDTYDLELPQNEDGSYPTYLFSDRAQADWFGAELQLGVTLKETPTLRDQLYFGLEGGYVSTVSQAFVADPASPDTVPADAVSVPVSAVVAGAYLQNELEINERFNFVAGLRFDYHQSFFRIEDLTKTISPRGAFIIRTKNDSTFKVMYARGFRNPAIYEAFFDDGTDIASNSNLKPESIHNLEFAYEYRLKKTLKLGLSTYYFRATDLLRQQTLCLDAAPSEECQEIRQQFQNIAQVEGQGSELTVVANLPHGWETRGTLTLQRATDLDADRPLTNSPGFIANLMASYPLLKDKAYLSTQVHVVGGRTAGPTAEDTFIDVPAYGLVNVLFSSRTWIKGLEVSAGVYNLLDLQLPEVAVTEELVVDRSDEPILTIPTDGRTFQFRAGYRF